MNDFFVVLAISYCGLCVGTFINLQKAKINQIERIIYAVFFPPIVLTILIWLAFEITKRDKRYAGLLKNIVICLAAYADAVSLIYVESGISLKLVLSEWKNRTKQILYDKHGNIATV